MAKPPHPHVITVFEVGTAEGQDFIAMELVEGETLGVWVQRAHPSWRAILAAFLAAGRGLAAAQTAGLVHRDFKPSNDARADARGVLLPQLHAEPELRADESTRLLSIVVMTASKEERRRAVLAAARRAATATTANIAATPRPSRPDGRMHLVSRASGRVGQQRARGSACRGLILWCLERDPDRDRGAD